MTDTSIPVSEAAELAERLEHHVGLLARFDTGLNLKTWNVVSNDILDAAKALRSSSAGSRDREEIAECIWRAEFRRGASRERLVPWSEVAELDREKYRYTADAILSLHPGSDVVQPSCEQSDSTTHRESVTRFNIAHNAMLDALAGWKYIRSHHGDLYGVGWDRVENKLTEALSALPLPSETQTDLGLREGDILHYESTDGVGKVLSVTRPIPPSAGDGEPVAFVPVHPKLGQLWGETYPADRDVTESRPQHYERIALYTHPQPAPEVREQLRKHVDHVRHYLHLQIGKPASKDLISAPEIALNTLARELDAALSTKAKGAES